MALNGFTKSIKVLSLSLAIMAQSLKTLFPLKNGRRLRAEFSEYRRYNVNRLRNTLKRLSDTTVCAIYASEELNLT